MNDPLRLALDEIDNRYSRLDDLLDDDLLDGLELYPDLEDIEQDYKYLDSLTSEIDKEW